MEARLLWRHLEQFANQCKGGPVCGVPVAPVNLDRGPHTQVCPYCTCDCKPL